MAQRTIFITGSSSGIGRAAVRLFSDRGWNVAATMRNPDSETELQNLPNVKVFRLDVLDKGSIKSAVEDSLKEFGQIDALVNNAGYAAIGPFEAADDEQISRQFETNLFGLMRVTRAVLPHFRERRQGVIINVSSVAGRTTFPLFSLYNSTKWAVEGFSEALWYELRHFNIKVKLIQPGAIKTDFYSRSYDQITKDELTDYHSISEPVFNKLLKVSRFAQKPEVVARKIFRTANSKNRKLRYPAGGGAGAMLLLRKIMPVRWFNYLIAGFMESKI